jgi:putative hemolysin
MKQLILAGACVLGLSCCASPADNVVPIGAGLNAVGSSAQYDMAPPPVLSTRTACVPAQGSAYCVRQ